MKAYIFRFFKSFTLHCLIAFKTLNKLYISSFSRFSQKTFLEVYKFNLRYLYFILFITFYYITIDICVFKYNILILIFFFKSNYKITSTKQFFYVILIVFAIRNRRMQRRPKKTETGLE